LSAAAQTTGVAAETLQRLAQEFAAARPALVLAGGRGENGLELVLAAAALNQTAGGGASVRPGEAIASFEGIAP
jgi:anaerobic selenocysteine-containing dehydrogenase